VAASIYGSNEYFFDKGGTPDGFLTGAYFDITGKQLDPASRLLYEGQLASGTPRETIALTFLTSSDGYQHYVSNLYPTLLRRPGDLGVNFWMNVLLGGARDEVVVAGLLSSPEYYSKFSV
jgi:hypothetical protein